MTTEKKVAVAPRTLASISLLGLLWENVVAAWKLRGIRPHTCAAVFGSARVEAASPWYEAAYQTGYALAAMGFKVLTGGGPGIMEAANKGASDGGGVSIGFNISLPYEQQPNKFIDIGHTFLTFGARLFWAFRLSRIFIFFPGGGGTDEELKSLICTFQVRKVDASDSLILMYDETFWTEVSIEQARKAMIEHGLAGDEYPVFVYVNSPEEVVTKVKNFIQKR